MSNCKIIRWAQLNSGRNCKIRQCLLKKRIRAFGGQIFGRFCTTVDHLSSSYVHKHSVQTKQARCEAVCHLPRCTNGYGDWSNLRLGQ